MRIGYVAIWRKIQDHVFYKEKRVYSKLEAWLDLLLEAQHYKEPRQVILGMNVFIQNYGESLKSMGTWAKRWGWSRAKVQRWLKLVQKMGQICYTNETVTTRITVLNYEKYDPKGGGSETVLIQKRDTSETQAKHKRAQSKNGKNGKKKELPKKEPFRLPDIDEIEDSAKPKLKSDLDKICQELYDKKIFIKVHAFRNTMLKARKNDRTILHALSRCYLKNTLKPFKNDSEAWAYCLKIIQIEDGNYHEKDHNKTN